MEVPEGGYEKTEVIMSQLEAEDYAGAIWRKPTGEELDELAQYFAEDYIRGEIDFLGLEVDHIEYIIRLNKDKENLIKEMLPLTTVMDLVKINVQIFYTYSFHISITSVTNQLFLEDNLHKMYKKDGKLAPLHEGLSIDL